MTGRLLQAPVFVLCAPRSGSTLLRALLGGHSALHAPAEPHLTSIRVHVSAEAEPAMAVRGLDSDTLQELLWDAVLHRDLTASGKATLVVKDPTLTLSWERVAACWPDARYVFLLRHPASIAASLQQLDPDHPAELFVRMYATALQQARTHLGGVDVRYEDLAAEPGRELARVCEHLGLGYEPGMLDYGQRHTEQEWVQNLGDWAEKIRSGRVQAARPLPGVVPERLQQITATWGYA